MRVLTGAIVGCGPRGFMHAEAVRASGAFSLKYACDIVPERAAKAADEWGVTATNDHRAVLDDPEVEVVINATDVGSHLPLAKDTIAAGKHMILEKPFGDDVSAARELVALSEQSTTVTYMSFQLRFSPQLAAIKDTLPAIDPVQIFFGRSRGMMKAQFLNPSPFCGIMDVCAHDFDVLSWFMGRQPEAVTAVIRRNTFTPDTGATDSISALVDFGDDRAATIISSIGAPEIGSKCDIAGARGNVVMHRGGAPSGVRFAKNESSGKREPIDFKVEGPDSPDAGLQLAFRQEVLTGTRSDAARPVDGLNSLLLTLACLRSAQEGRRVRLSELG